MAGICADMGGAESGTVSWLTSLGLPIILLCLRGSRRIRRRDLVAE